MISSNRRSVLCFGQWSGFLLISEQSEKKILEDAKGVEYGYHKIQEQRIY